HLEFFKSVSDIARAKYELIESLPSGGTAVLNADDEYISQFGRDFKGKVVTYGLGPTADVRAENIKTLGAGGSTFDVVVGGCRERCCNGGQPVKTGMAVWASTWRKRKLMCW